MTDSLFQFQRRPAFLAARDTLVSLGYARRNILGDFQVAVSRHDPRWAVNAIAFSDSIAHIENACVTVFDLSGSGLPREEAVSRLRHTTAPFHFLYDEMRGGFDVCVVSPGEVTSLASAVAPERLTEAVSEFATDLRPDAVSRVKRGLGAFTHGRLAQLRPLQLVLWAEEANGQVLDERFRHALHELSREGIATEPHRSKLAAQLLAARILMDTRAMPECDAVRDIPQAAERQKFFAYFDEVLLRRLGAKAQRAYEIFRGISFATFQPEMLRTLYKSLFSRAESKARGRFDTPLWLTRRIWRQIPVEFLPPEQRIVADLTCGWGSFLISAHERLAALPDMGNRRLSHYIFGNDSDPTTKELARVALLTSTGRDSWEVSAEDGRAWTLAGPRRPGIIVGNPPFLGDRKRQTNASTGGRRTELANDFLQHAVDLLADGGYLAMVMPQSFVASEAGPTVRKALLERCDIIEMWDLPGQVFESAAVQPMVLFARKVPGKSAPSPQPVRIRNCQKVHLNALKERGEFTRSSIHTNQETWTAGRRSGRTTHVFDFTGILNAAEWKQIHDVSVPLESIAEVVPGCIKGSLSRCRTKLDKPKNVKLLAKASTTLPREFRFDYSQAMTVVYPNEIEEPRYESRQVFEAAKVLLVSDPNPSWGRRVKLGIERRGLYPAEGFFAVAPNTSGAGLGVECLAAVLRWKVANAWTCEHLRYPKINASILRRLPVPKVLLTEAAVRPVRNLVLRIEQAAQLGRPDAPSEAALDTILREAYGLTDDSLWERLCAIYQWDSLGDDAISFDPPVSDVHALWEVQGKVEKVLPDSGQLVLWLDCFDVEQTVPIVPAMPGWLLRVGAQFRSAVPETEVRAGRLSGKKWGYFEPAYFTYLTRVERARRINAAVGNRRA